eukprot:2511082-Amphidinium_carterae.1
MVATKKTIDRCWLVHLDFRREEFQHSRYLVLWSSHLEVINVYNEDATCPVMYECGWPVRDWSKAKRSH